MMKRTLRCLASLSILSSLLLAGASTAQAQSTTTIPKKRLGREIRERARSADRRARWKRKGTVGRLSNPEYDRLVDHYADCSYWATQKRMRQARLVRLNEKLADPDTSANQAAEVQATIAQTQQEIQDLDQKLAGCTHNSRADFIEWLINTYGDAALQWQKAGKHDGETVRRHPRLPPDGCGDYTFATFNTKECREGHWWSIDYNYYGLCDIATEVTIVPLLDENGALMPCEPDSTPLYPSSAVSFEDAFMCVAPETDDAGLGALKVSAQAGFALQIQPLGNVDLGGDTLLVDEPFFGSAEVVGNTIFYSAPLTFSGPDELIFTVVSEAGERYSLPVVIEVAAPELVMTAPKSLSFDPSLTLSTSSGGGF